MLRVPQPSREDEGLLRYCVALGSPLTLKLLMIASDESIQSVNGVVVHLMPCSHA